MASLSFSRGLPVGKFPVQLAQGVLQDLLAKDLEARADPANEAKKIAFEGAVHSMPRRIKLVLSQVQATDAGDIANGFGGLCEELWKFIASRPSEIQPGVLESSFWIEPLTWVFEVACIAAGPFKSQLQQGGLLVRAALSGIGTISEEPTPAAKVAQLTPLIKWWADEICGKRWRVVDAWGMCNLDGALESPMHAIAEHGFAALVPLAVERGCSVNGDLKGTSLVSPAVLAMRAGNAHVVEAMMAHGLDLLCEYKGDGGTLAVSLLCNGGRCPAFFVDLLRKRPELVNVSASLDSKYTANLLCAALWSRSPALVDLVLSAGGQVEYRCNLAGESNVTRPSLSIALITGNAESLQLLITKGKALEDWRSKYSDEALGDISVCLARLAISAYPSNPRFKADPSFLVKYNPQAMKCLDMILASGLVCPWDGYMRNSLLHRLYPRDDEGWPVGCVVEEKHALELLQKYHGAGFAVQRWREEASGYEADAVALPRAAASVGQPLVLDWSLTQLAAPIELLEGAPVGDSFNTLVSLACTVGSAPCILLLLEKYKVSAAYPDRGLYDQPAVNFLSRLEGFSDTAAAKIMDALADRDPSLFSLACYSEANIAKEEANNKDLDTSVTWNPLFMCTVCDRPLTLEALLKRNLPGVNAMANRPVATPGVLGTGMFVRPTPAQVAAKLGKWDCLSLLLRYTDASVTKSFDRLLESTLQLLRPAAGMWGGPSRTLLASVEARAKKERAEGSRPPATGAATRASAPKPAVATNAFEDPSLHALTEKEAKKKAKKKAAKKKAKAKKRAAASGGAGDAAAPDEDDSEDSLDGNEDEPDDNLVDSRNAPSLDALMTQMGLKCE